MGIQKSQGKPRSSRELNKSGKETMASRESPVLPVVHVIPVDLVVPVVLVVLVVPVDLHIILRYS